MMDMQDFDSPCFDAISNDVPQWGNDEFARAFESSRSAHIGVYFEPGSGFPNTFYQVRRCNGIVSRDIVNRLM